MSDDTGRPNLESRRNCTFIKADGKRCTKLAQPGKTRCWHHSYKVPGRPGKLTPELSEKVIQLMLEGNYLTTAAQAVGVSERTLHRWLERGDDVEAKALEQAEEDGDLYEHISPDEWVYLDFRHAVKSAAAYAETELLRQAATGALGWQAPMTILERRHPQRWRRSDRHEHEHTGAVATTVEHVKPDEGKRTEIAGILDASGALDAPGENTDQDDQEDSSDA